MKSFKQFLKEEVAPTDEAGNAKQAIMQLFKDNEKVDDSMVHELSDKLGIDTYVFEGMIYDILSSFFHAGKALNFNGSFDPKQLEMGIKVEMEHTTDPKIAERIARDHLTEDPLYYTHLIEMEAEAGIKESNQINESGEFKKGDIVSIYDRKGIIKKIIGGNVAEVDFPATKDYIARTDRYYTSELKKEIKI